MKLHVHMMIGALMVGGCSDGGFMWPGENDAGTNISIYTAPMREDGTMRVAGRVFTSADAIDPIATYITIGENVSQTVQSPAIKTGRCYKGLHTFEARVGLVTSTVRLCLEGEAGVRIHETTRVTGPDGGESKTSYGELVARYRHEGYTLGLHDIAMQGDLVESGGVPGNRIIINDIGEGGFPLYILHHRYLHPVRMSEESFSDWKGTLKHLPSKG